MAKKGDLARESVRDTIINAFKEKDSFVCIQDKKIYVEAKDGDNGEVYQFAISMTMPKTPVEGISFEKEEPSKPAAVELSESDKAKVEELKRMLGF